LQSELSTLHQETLRLRKRSKELGVTASDIETESGIRRNKIVQCVGESGEKYSTLKVLKAINDALIRIITRREETGDCITITPETPVVAFCWGKHAHSVQAAIERGAALYGRSHYPASFQLVYNPMDGSFWYESIDCRPPRPLQVAALVTHKKGAYAAIPTTVGRALGEAQG